MTKTYEEACVLPKSRKEWGDYDNTQAWAAQVLSSYVCIQPHAIYNWAQAKGIPLATSMPDFLKNPKETALQILEGLYE